MRTQQRQRYWTRWPARRLAASLVLGVLLLSGAARSAAASPPLSGPLTPGARAAAALAALNNHWFIGGDFPGAGIWSGTSSGWWQNAIALAAVLDAYERSGSPSLRAQVASVYLSNGQSMRHAVVGMGAAGAITLQAGFVGYAARPGGSYGVDDEGWWALDWIRAWDLTGQRAYLTTAQHIFANMASTWSSACGGGVWWKVPPSAQNQKNSVSNGLFLLVAAELAERLPSAAGGATDLYWARREAAWLLHSGMLAPDGLVFNNLSGTCRPEAPMFTYNQGVVLAGLGLLGVSTHDAVDLAAAARIAAASMRTLISPGGVLADPCEAVHPTWCNRDAEEFKGIFVADLWYLDALRPNAPLRTFLRRALQSLWQTDRSPGNRFGFRWYAPPAHITLETDTSATLALNATALSASQELWSRRLPPPPHGAAPSNHHAPAARRAIHPSGVVARHRSTRSATMPARVAAA